MPGHVFLFNCIGLFFLGVPTGRPTTIAYFAGQEPDNIMEKHRLLILPKKLTCLLLVLVVLLNHSMVSAQEPVSPKPVVSVLLPLQLDSFYTADKYKFGNNIPKQILPYLEFYNGVLLAADSLNREGAAVHIEVVDTRRFSSLNYTLNDPVVRQSKMLIAVAQNSFELKQMADFAKELHIPLISATYPNDAGIKNTPELYLVNTTLKSHCGAIYQYLQRNHASDNLVFVTRKGSIETYLKNWIDDAAPIATTNKLQWKLITLSDSFQVSQIKALLDSNSNNTLIAATMDKPFGQRLIKQLSGLQPKYKSLVVGMPNWDDIDFRKPDYKGVEITYSTPFISSSGNIDVYNSLSKAYAKKQNSKPSDMAIKGFELTYRFVKNLLAYPIYEDFADHANDRSFKVFCDFDFVPVSEPGNESQINYFENRKLYFIRKKDGVLKGIY